MCDRNVYSAAGRNSNLKNILQHGTSMGFLKPVHEMVIQDDPLFKANKRFKLDMFNVVLGIIAQCCMTILPMYIVLWMKLPLLITVIVLFVIAIILKKTWWDKLED